MLSPVVTVIPLQLLAYHIAALRGLDVDQPATWPNPSPSSSASCGAAFQAAAGLLPASAPPRRPVMIVEASGELPMRTEWIEKRKTDKIRTEMHYARQGLVTPEMEHVARRENLSPSWFAPRSRAAA